MDSGKPRRRSFLRWRERTQKAVASRRVFPFLLVTTAGLGLLSGFVVTLVDKKDFPTFGIGIWWAIVTLGTVGYGDVVPHTAWGRVVGSVVIVIGITFLAFLTATVTSLFVSSERAEATEHERERREAVEEETFALLRTVEQRLAA